MSKNRIDPITLEVIRHASIAAAEETKTNLMRTAYNPIIYEVLDFSCGVFDHRGNMIAQADGLPIFLGNLAATIRVVIDDIGLENFRPGDLISVKAGGGGGWGDPVERDPEKVQRDVRAGYISFAAAKKEYGVVLDRETLEIDREATEKLRPLRTTVT